MKEWYLSLPKTEQPYFWLLMFILFVLLFLSWVVWMLRTRSSYIYETPSGKKVTIEFSLLGYTFDGGFNYYPTSIMAEQIANSIYPQR